MIRRFLRWLFGPVESDRTLTHNLHYALRGSNDTLLDRMEPLDQAWLEKHSN